MIRTILKMIYPSSCIFCNKNLEFNKQLEVCDDCYNKLNFFDNNNCCDKVEYVKYYDKVLAAFFYDGEIKKLIKEFKYKHKAYLYRTFARLIFDNIKNIEADIMLSVPLYQDRQKERGYNQAHLLAYYMSKLMKIKYCEKVLKRIKTTDSLALCNKMQRSNVIKGAFKVEDKEKIRDKNIIIIDDVFTTGATINECSKILKLNGAKNITAIVLAKTK